MPDVLDIPETVDDALREWDRGAEVWSIRLTHGDDEQERRVQFVFFEILRMMDSLSPDMDWSSITSATSLTSTLLQCLVTIRVAVGLPPLSTKDAVYAGVMAGFVAASPSYREALIDAATAEHDLMRVRRSAPRVEAPHDR